MLDVDFDSNFILTSDIEIVTINVTEQIIPQFLNEFLLTTIETNNIILDDNSYIWHKFFDHINLYEIYIINSKKNSFDIYPNILHKFYIDDKNSDRLDLFILRNVFVVYNSCELYCFKSFKYSSNEDIINYVEQVYKLSLDNIYLIDEVRLNELKKEYIKNNNNYNKPKFIKLKKNNHFILFCIFSIFCILIFSTHLYDTFDDISNKNEVKLSQIKNKYENLKQNRLEHKRLVLALTELFKYIKLENIIINKIIYENNSIKLALMHKNKDKLLNFTTIYNGKFTIERIEFLKEMALYKMVINIAN